MRKGILHFIIFFLIGAIINIVVAWSWILFVPNELISPMGFYGIPKQPSDRVIKSRLPKYVFVRSDLFDFNEFELNNRGYEHYSVFGTEVDSRGIDSAVPLYIWIKAGWPLQSFDGEFFMTADGLDRSFAFYVPESWFDHVEYYILPFRPTWPGFVINTVLYGGVPWLLICGPFVLRRHRRRKRNQCVKCGYPKGESDVCTECGLALKPVASNAAK